MNHLGLVNNLMMMSVLERLPTPRYPSLVCCAGTRGHHAFKEMLRTSRGPSAFLLVESGDIIDVVAADAEAPSPKQMHRIYEASVLHNSVAFSELTFDLKGLYSVHLILTNVRVLVFSFSCFSFNKIEFLELPFVVELPPKFLSDCRYLKAFDLAQLSHLKISPYCLSGCLALTTVDLTPLEHLTEIPDGFLSGCRRLRALDLSPLSKLKALPRGFLFECASLTALDLCPLSQVTTIPSMFLSSCSDLKTLDLRPLSGVTSVGNQFLSGCCSLVSLDLTPLSHLSELPMSFLSACNGLTVLDLSPFAHLKKLPKGFLSGCSGLKELDLRPLTRLTKVAHSIREEFKGRLILPSQIKDKTHS